MRKLDSKLESEGAEFLVLGHLLIEGIPAYKAYVRSPGYDLVATWPETNRSARIQVKSRWATDYDGGFLVKNFDFDFLVFVELNRGYRYSKKSLTENGRCDPRFFVLTQEATRGAIYSKSNWSKAFLKLIDGVETYQNAWGLIRNFLHKPASATAS